MQTQEITGSTVEVRGEHVFTLYDQNGWIVAKYNDPATSKEFVACGNGLPTIRHAVIRFNGKWEKSRYGEQFKVVGFSVELPKSELGMVSYLSSLKVGIGKKKAAAIYRQFGAETWSVLDERPQELLQVPGITQHILDGLISKLADTHLLRELMEAFHGSIDVSLAQVQKIVGAFGASALQIIRSQPYRLCSISGFSFPEVDKMALAGGTKADDMERGKAAALYLLEREAAMGHVCIPRERLLQGLERLLSKGVSGAAVTKETCLMMLREAWTEKQIKTANGMVYSRKRHEQEVTIAKELLRLHAGLREPTPEVSGLVKQFEEANAIALSESQREAVEGVFSHPVTIITGGPGTGKTTITRAILSVFEEVYGDESYAELLAPTGRAARRMYEATGHAATTIHAAIGYHGVDEEYELEERGQLGADLIIVDESSMLDQYIASILLQMIPDGSRVVFVGDPDQLPSVGCGNVLADMIQSKRIPTYKLSVIFRQAGDNPIVFNSQQVRMGDPTLEYGDEFKMIQGHEDEEIFGQACDLYMQYVRELDIDRVVLLCPLRKKTRLAVNEFNQELQRRVNPLVTGEPTMKVRGVEFRIGDKVMQTKNTMSAKNGDVGYIREIVKCADPNDMAKLTTMARIEFNGDGTKLLYSADEMMHVALAYCTTVHKAQGSEYHTVIMVVSHRHEFMLRRNLIYTGVTRACEQVILVGEESALEKAILDGRSDTRYTLLRGRLQINET